MKKMGIGYLSVQHHKNEFLSSQRSVMTTWTNPGSWSIMCNIFNIKSIIRNTPGTRGGRDRTLAVKGRKNARKISFFRKK